MADERDFTEGLDPSGETQISASQLLQLIREATPNTDRGLVIIDDTEPDAVNFTKFQRYLWVRPVENLKIIRVWDTSASPSPTWKPIIVGTGAIGTAQIADEAITLPKLYAPGVGEALKLLRVNAGGTGFELWAFALVDGSVTLAKIDKGSGNAEKLIRVKTDNSGLEYFVLDATAYIAANALNISKINPTGLARQFLRINNGDTACEWVYFDPAIDLDLNSVPVDTLIPGTALYYLRTNAAGTYAEWAAFPQLPAVIQTSGTVALPAGFGAATIAHGLGAIPKFLRVVFVNVTPEFGYIAGDEVDVQSMYYADTALSVQADATNVIITFSNNNPLLIQRQDIDADGTVTRASWLLKAYYST